MYQLSKVLLTRRLHTLTHRANERLGQNPALALEEDILSASQYAAGSDPRVAPMNYGHAVEEMVARDIRFSNIDNLLFKHVGGRSNPDFVGRGLF